MRRLRDFQDQGHIIVLIIGDYTARIGDPTGKKKTRPMLTSKEIETNAKTYLKQIGKILDMKKVEIHWNSKWFDKISIGEWLKIMANFTVAQILERDDFSKRLKSNQDVGLHEIIYPVVQAYDSVMVKADVEVGGTDQKFNMLAGRDLQRKMGQKPQDVLTVPLLVGLDGKEKMSKSLGNAVGITDLPNDMFGKIMSIPDELILPYFTLATDLSEGGLQMVKKELEEGVNPREIKARLAYLIVELYYDTITADQASQFFDRTFRDKKTPKEMPEILLDKEKKGNIVDLLTDLQITASKNEAKRLVDQGGIKINEVGINDVSVVFELKKDDIIQIGKRRFFRVVYKK
jgi:tyrosyl-tRNA synthetase